MERLKSRVEQRTPLQEGIVKDGPVRIDLDTLLSETEEVASAPWKAYKEMSIDDESDDRIIKEFTPDGEVRIISIKNGIPKETTYGEKGRKLHEEGTLRAEHKGSPYRFYTSEVALVGTDRDGNSINQGRVSLADDFRSFYERIHGAGSYPEAVSASQTAEPAPTAPAETALLEAQREQIEALTEQSRLLIEQNEELRRQNELLTHQNELLRQQIETQQRDKDEAIRIAAAALDVTQRENADLKGKLRDANTEIVLLQTEVNYLSDDKSKLSRQVQELDSRVGELELADAVPAAEDEEDEALALSSEAGLVDEEVDEEMEATPWPGGDGIDPVVVPVKDHEKFRFLKKSDRQAAIDKVEDLKDGPAKKKFFLLDVKPEIEGAHPEPLVAGTEVEIPHAATASAEGNGAYPAGELPEGVRIDHFKDGREQPRRGGRWVSRTDYRTSRDREAEIEVGAASVSGNGTEASQVVETSTNGESNGHAHSTIRRQVIRTGEVGAQMSESAIRYLRGRRSEVDAILGDHSLSESVRAAQLVEMAAAGKAKSRRKGKDDEDPIFVSVRDYSTPIAS